MKSQIKTPSVQNLPLRFEELGISMWQFNDFLCSRYSLLWLKDSSRKPGLQFVSKQKDAESNVGSKDVRYINISYMTCIWLCIIMQPEWDVTLQTATKCNKSVFSNKQTRSTMMIPHHLTAPKLHLPWLVRYSSNCLQGNLYEFHILTPAKSFSEYMYSSKL